MLPRMEFNSKLQMFSQNLAAPEAFARQAKSIMQNSIFKAFKNSSKYSIDRYKMVGGLEKKTSTPVKPDADVVIYYNNKGMKREDILNEFKTILLGNNIPQEGVQITRNGTIKFDSEGIPFDLLIAENNVVNASVRDTAREQMRNSILKIKQSGGYPRSVAKLGAETSESSVEFLKSKSKFVHDVARLGKYWSQTILFKHYVYGKSLIMELLATKAAMDEEFKNNHPSICKAFENYLKMICNIKKQDVVFDDYYGRSDIPHDILIQRPLLMDPTNPYNNLLDMTRNQNLKEFFDVFSDCAGHTLSIMENGCTDIPVIFLPQPMLHTLRGKEKLFMPKSFIIAVTKEEAGEKDSLLKPEYTIRDGKGKEFQRDVEALLHSTAAFAYNKIKTITKTTNSDIKEAVQDFVDKMDGDQTPSVAGKGKHEDKAVTLAIPLGDSNVLRLSFNYDAGSN